MAKSLIITEKPSVARDIAGALGGFPEHDGYFESDTWVLTFAVGHLFELLEPEEIDPSTSAGRSTPFRSCPTSSSSSRRPIRPSASARSSKLLERKDVDGVVNACDAGREGELIFREIVEHLEGTKPIRRLWLQSMTEDAIRDGFAHLRPGEELEGLAAAAQCARADGLADRHERDPRAHQAPEGPQEKSAWSAGRVQTPTLAMLVERELEVLAHVPKPYWRLVGTFDHGGNAYTGNWFDPALDDPDDDADPRRPRLRRGARAGGRREGRRVTRASRKRRASRRARPRRRSSI